MKIWKRNAVIAAVLLFICAGIYLNWAYAGHDETQDLTQTLNADQVLDDATMVIAPSDDALQTAATEGLDETTGAADYFAAMRLSRQEARDSAVTTLQETIAYAGDDAAATSASSDALDDLMTVSLQEAQIESLIIAKGYTDCVAYMTDDGINVAVAAPAEGLQDADVALLADVVTGQSDYQLADIHIIEVK